MTSGRFSYCTDYLCPIGIARCSVYCGPVKQLSLPIIHQEQAGDAIEERDSEKQPSFAGRALLFCLLIEGLFKKQAAKTAFKKFGNAEPTHNMIRPREYCIWLWA